MTQGFKKENERYCWNFKFVIHLKSFIKHWRSLVLNSELQSLAVLNPYVLKLNIVFIQNELNLYWYMYLYLFSVGWLIIRWIPAVLDPWNLMFFCVHLHTTNVICLWNLCQWKCLKISCLHSTYLLLIQLIIFFEPEIHKFS